MRARTTCSAWRDAGACSTGQARASTTASRNGSPGSDTSTRAGSRARRRERTVYTLTDKGLQALRDYGSTPVRFTPLKSDPLLRLLIADLVGEDPTRASIATLREDIADLSARLDESEASAELLPHRRKYLLIVVGFLRRLLDLHLELVDEVERELASDGQKPAPADASAGSRAYDAEKYSSSDVRTFERARWSRTR